ncbi:hypothetical protein [uncultured Flavobacterium sp.]|uniref:hypothetical protein n=1 Tax=uncultured Flavobacterium sp. TaxID=165435 RepID=UPI0025F50E63|nr:hypothetical protein [uncultured Flavobacterium sp.]
MNRLPALLLFLFSAVAMAQEVRVLKGRAITDIGNVEGVKVANMVTGTSAATGNEGSFMIRACKGDTLKFTGELYRPLIVVLREKDFAEELFIVRLVPVATMLDEVQVSGLTGNLAADSKNLKTMQVNTWFDPVEINKDVLPQSGIGANWITGIAHLFKKKKTPKRATAYQPSADHVEKIPFSEVVRQMYADNFFTESLTIPSRFIGAFLDFCNEDARQYLLMVQNEPQLLDYLKSKSAVFLKLNPDIGK